MISIPNSYSLIVRRWYQCWTWKIMLVSYDNRRILIHYFSWLYDHQTTSLKNLYAYCRGFAYKGIFLPLGGYDNKGWYNILHVMDTQTMSGISLTKGWIFSQRGGISSEMRWFINLHVVWISHEKSDSCWFADLPAQNPCIYRWEFFRIIKRVINFTVTAESTSTDRTLVSIFQYLRAFFPKTNKDSGNHLEIVSSSHSLRQHILPRQLCNGWQHAPVGKIPFLAS